MISFRFGEMKTISLIRRMASTGMHITHNCGAPKRGKVQTERSAPAFQLPTFELFLLSYQFKVTTLSIPSNMSTSRNTLGRLTSLPRSIRIGRPAKPAQSRQSSSSSTSASPCSSWTYGNPSEKAVASRLPPIRAHILREPLPYPVGLKLQNDIIDLRLKRRETGAAGAKAGVDGGGKGGKVDVMLLVGAPSPTASQAGESNK